MPTAIQISLNCMCVSLHSPVRHLTSSHLADRPRHLEGLTLDRCLTTKGIQPKVRDRSSATASASTTSTSVVNIAAGVDSVLLLLLLLLLLLQRLLFLLLSLSVFLYTDYIALVCTHHVTQYTQDTQ